MSKIISRLQGEPIATRAAVAGVLNLLVFSGVIDTGASEVIETAVMAQLNLLLLLGARKRVAPERTKGS